MVEKYEAIINLPRHTSLTRKKMDLHDRAAQFAPYAALVGFGDVVDETARFTESRALQDEGEAARINRTLTYIIAHGGEINAKFTYFEKDKRKRGGRHVKKTGFAVKIDEEKRTIIFLDKTTLPLDDIVEIVLI